jgi:hypothetical protein
MGAIPWAAQFQNGDVAAKKLMIDFDGEGHFLQPSAARSLQAFAHEFELAFGAEFTISEAFRDIPTQQRLYDLWRTGKGNVAAVPGTSSHGQGLAVDINSWVYGSSQYTDRHRWLRENAPRFGWSWELVGKPSGEPWHFNYVGGFADWASSSNWEDIMTKLDDDDREFIRGQMSDVKSYVRTLLWGSVDSETDSFAHFLGTNVANSQEALKSWNRDLLWGNVVTPGGATTPSLTGFIGDNIKGSQEAIIGKLDEKP